MSASKIIDSRQLGKESIFLNDNTHDHINLQGQHQGSKKQNAEIVAFGLSKYKTLLTFVGSAMVGRTRSNDNQCVSLSQEEVQFVSGHHENIGIYVRD